ncbi:MAG TPA: hypothetical protein VGD71_22285 [Kribbella sp.]
MRQAQDCAPDDPFGQGLRQTYNDLETERRTTLATLAELDAAEGEAPARPTSFGCCTCPRRGSNSIRTNPYPS